MHCTRTFIPPPSGRRPSNRSSFAKLTRCSLVPENRSLMSTGAGPPTPENAAGNGL